MGVSNTMPIVASSKVCCVLWCVCMHLTSLCCVARHTFHLIHMFTLLSNGRYCKNEIYLQMFIRRALLVATRHCNHQELLVNSCFDFASSSKMTFASRGNEHECWDEGTIYLATLRPCLCPATNPQVHSVLDLNRLGPSLICGQGATGLPTSRCLMRTRRTRAGNWVPGHIFRRLCGHP